MTAYVQPSSTMPSYFRTPFTQKEPAALGGALRFALGCGRMGGALRFALGCGRSRSRSRAVECRVVETCDKMMKAKDSTGSVLTVFGITHRAEETIFPMPSDHPPLHQLSKLDQIFSPDEASPILMFFTAATGGGASADETVRSLKRSLSEVLSIFYPMAGRLAQRPGSATHLDVSCLDQGVPFSEAWADCPLSLFYPDFQPHPSFHLLTPRPFSYDPDALLYIQVTHFTCGGFSICMQEKHILNDGVSFCHFFKSWADILNGKRDLIVHPYMDSSILEDGYQVDNLLTSPSHQYDQTFYIPPPTDFESQSKWTFTSKIFHFTPNLIAALRDEAKLLRNPTSYECIIAYIWQNVTEVNQSSLDEKTTLVFPVDIRRRLRPCLPQGYFGNAIIRGYTFAKVEDLVANQGLSYAMSLVRYATSTIKSDFIKLALDWLGKQPSTPPPLHVGPKHVASEKGLYANTWARIPFSDVNFPWGKAYCLRTHFDPNFVGNCALVLPSPLGKDHLDVLVKLECEKMVKFQDLII